MNDVDKKIVQMQFDNAAFESKIRQTLNSLKNLEDELGIVGSNADFSNIYEQSDNAKKSLDNLSREVSSTGNSFNAFGIMVSQVFRNIATDAYALSKTLVKTLNSPINQIINGGIARAQKIANAKFQFEGIAARSVDSATGAIVQWDDILKDINYGVEDTAYGLDAAATVASQLFAANVSIGEDMKNALRGISGVAAMTNSTYEEIGHIYSQVAAQNRLSGMQVEMLTLRGLPVYSTLAKSAEFAGKTEEEIKKMVSAGQIGFQQFANAMDEAFGEHAKDANDTFSGAMSNVRAALSRIGAEFASPAFDKLVTVLNDVIPLIKGIKAMLTPLFSAWNYSLTLITDKVHDLMRSREVVTAIFSLFRSGGSWVAAVLNGVGEFLSSLGNLNAAGSSVKDFFDNLHLTGKSMYDVKEATKSILSMITDIASIVGYIVKDSFGLTRDILGVILGRTLKITFSLKELEQKLDRIKNISKFISGITRYLLQYGLEKIIKNIADRLSKINWSAVREFAFSTAGMATQLFLILSKIADIAWVLIGRLTDYLPYITTGISVISSKLSEAYSILAPFVDTLFGRFQNATATVSISTAGTTQISETATVMQELASDTNEATEALVEAQNVIEQLSSSTRTLEKDVRNLQKGVVRPDDLRGTNSIKRRSVYQTPEIAPIDTRKEAKKTIEYQEKLVENIRDKERTTKGAIESFTYSVLDKFNIEINTFSYKIIEAAQSVDAAFETAKNYITDKFNSLIDYISNLSAGEIALDILRAGNFVLLASQIAIGIKIISEVVLIIIHGVETIDSIMQAIPTLIRGLQVKNATALMDSIGSFLMDMALAIGAMSLFVVVIGKLMSKSELDNVAHFISTVLDYAYKITLVAGATIVLYTAFNTISNILSTKSLKFNFSKQSAQYYVNIKDIFLSMSLLIATIVGGMYLVAKNFTVDELKTAGWTFAAIIGALILTVLAIGAITKKFDLTIKDTFISDGNWTFKGGIKNKITHTVSDTMGGIKTFILTLIPYIGAIIGLLWTVKYMEPEDLENAGIVFVSAVSLLLATISLVALSFKNFTAKGGNLKIKTPDYMDKVMHSVSGFILSIVAYIGVLTGLAYVLNKYPLENLTSLITVMSIAVGSLLLCITTIGLLMKSVNSRSTIHSIGETYQKTKSVLDSKDDSTITSSKSSSMESGVIKAITGFVGAVTLYMAAISGLAYIASRMELADVGKLALIMTTAVASLISIFGVLSLLMKNWSSATKIVDKGFVSNRQGRKGKVKLKNQNDSNIDTSESQSVDSSAISAMTSFIKQVVFYMAAVAGLGFLIKNMNPSEVKSLMQLLAVSVGLLTGFIAFVSLAAKNITKSTKDGAKTFDWSTNSGTLKALIKFVWALVAYMGTIALLGVVAKTLSPHQMSSLMKLISTSTKWLIGFLAVAGLMATTINTKVFSTKIETKAITELTKMVASYGLVMGALSLMAMMLSGLTVEQMESTKKLISSATGAITVMVGVLSLCARNFGEKSVLTEAGTSDIIKIIEAFSVLILTIGGFAMMINMVDWSMLTGHLAEVWTVFGGLAVLIGLVGTLAKLGSTNAAGFVAVAVSLMGSLGAFFIAIAIAFNMLDNVKWDVIDKARPYLIATIGVLVGMEILLTILSGLAGGALATASLVIVALGAFFIAAAAAFNIVGSALESISAGLTGLLSAPWEEASDAVSGLATLVNGLFSIGPKIVVLSLIAPVLSIAFKGFAEALAVLSTVRIQNGDEICTFLRNFLSAINDSIGENPYLLQMFEAFVENLPSIATKLGIGALLLAGAGLGLIIFVKALQMFAALMPEMVQPIVDAFGRFIDAMTGIAGMIEERWYEINSFALQVTKMGFFLGVAGLFLVTAGITLGLGAGLILLGAMGLDSAINRLRTVTDNITAGWLGEAFANLLGLSFVLGIVGAASIVSGVLLTLGGGATALGAGLMWGATELLSNALETAYDCTVLLGQIIIQLRNDINELNTLVDAAQDVGTNIVDGIGEGINNAADNVFSVTQNIGTGIIDTIVTIFDIHSPSRVMAQIGSYITGGLIEGLEDDVANVETTVSNIANNSILGNFCDIMGIHSNSDAMIDCGQFIDGGLVEGMENGTDDIEDTTSGIANMISNAFGIDLTSNGAQAMMSFVNGAASKIPALKSLLAGAGNLFGVGSTAADNMESRYHSNTSTARLGDASRAMYYANQSGRISDTVNNSATNDTYDRVSDAASDLADAIRNAYGITTRPDPEKTYDELYGPKDPKDPNTTGDAANSIAGASGAGSGINNRSRSGLGDTINSNNTTYNYVQNNYSPEALSRTDIYLQTQNQLRSMQIFARSGN